MNEWMRVVSSRSHSMLDRLRVPALLRTCLRHIKTMDTEFHIPTCLRLSIPCAK